MTRFLKDRYFWYIAIMVVLTGVFTYAADIAALIGLAAQGGWELTYYVALHRFLFIVSVAIAAWRFGVKGGLATCFILGLIILSSFVLSLWPPDIWLQIGIISVSILFSWLIGKQGKMKRLLEENTEELRRQAARLSLEISQRQQAEDEIRDSEKRYRLLAENATDVIWTVDVKSPTRLTYISPSVTRLLGYSVEEAKAKTMEEVFTPASFEIAMKVFTEELIIENMEKKDLARSRTLELELNCKDGSLVPVEINGGIVRDPDGKAVEILVIARDISERKQMEEQLVMTDRLASIGELASGIAHEINNPLTSIIGFSQLLIERNTLEDTKEDLDIIHSEAQRAAGIVKNLLTFSRKHAPVKQVSQVNSIIEEVLKLHAYEQKVSNIKVHTQFTSDLPEIMVDYFQMQQVFLNVIINAESAMSDAHNKGTLTVTTERVNGIIRASFVDDGPGISKENLSRIFTPFFTTKAIGKGTGLGLSICHGIVTEHGGRIYARNGLSKGATFIVELPINGH